MDKRINTAVMDEIMRVGSEMQEMELVNTFEGNLSIREGDLMYITPGRTSKKALNHDNICVIDLAKGEQIWGGRPSSETIMHKGAYTVKEGVNACIHCHPPVLTAYAMANKSIEVKCHPEILFHYHDIPCTPYGRPGSEEIIENARPYLLHRNLVLMANHGVLSIGSSLALACQRIVSAEKLGKELIYANLIGGTKDIPEPEIYRLMGRPLDL
ncbi:MAG: class II aldolase/adducin family protein [Lachnospiraceae bacterium]|nr:class II aldolase/adducin family protein [Lachnospiraceae bacterium]